MTETVPGPTAALLDVWARVALFAAILVVILGGVLASIPVLVLAAVLFGAAIMLGVRSARAMAREKNAGYSTIYDVPGFALRDARTKQLLRAADTEPVGGGRRSILRAMFTVKPGTVLAKRLEEERD
ncbi:MAG: hypothetical protein BGO97_11715 [Micrococcales bacterium 70-64]|nr:hypothetical protein [Leifsonia sp.]ODU64634.1 MAG: hypothetical protein ABT06_11720 [Leifsonia sp. SCN 70-46]OJX86326.1 MAG: hypothetical protein BGO97_11715 [Micrococcales bacterium 70-64]